MGFIMAVLAAVFGIAWLALGGVNTPDWTPDLTPDNAPNSASLPVSPSDSPPVNLALAETQTPPQAPVVRAAIKPSVNDDDFARIVSERADLTTVTIYPDNLALITEVRKVTLPKGGSVIAFEGVSDLIIPQSMILREFTGMTLERDFDYSLLSKTTLFENAVGESVFLTRFDKASGAVVKQEAQIISARRDSGVVMRVEGKIETLSCSGLTERVSFGSARGNLSAKPVMSVRVRTEQAGEQEVVVSYLTSGLGWRADYRADLKGTIEDKPTGTRAASLLAWLTLTNDTAKDYSDVPLAIIAGDLNRDRETRAVAAPKPYMQAQCYPIGDTKRGIRRLIPHITKQRTEYRKSAAYGGAAPMMEMSMMSDEIVVTGNKARTATEENVGDYKLYRVPGLVSVKPYQTKQIAFLDEDSVEISRYFKAEVRGAQNNPNPVPLRLAYSLNNDREGGLARSLPKGTFRIFDTRANGKAVYLAESYIDNLAVDEEVELVTGRSMSVQMKTTGRGSRDLKSKFLASHSVFNALGEAVRIKLINRDERLLGNVITVESTARDPDEIIPTWWFDVRPEAVGELAYGVKFEMRYFVDLDGLVEVEAGKPLDDLGQFRIERGLYIAGTNRPVDDSYMPSVSTNVSEMNAVTKVISAKLDKDGNIVLEVKHSIANTSGQAQTIEIAPNYRRASRRSFEVLESTLKPDNKAEARWTLEIADGETKALRYSVKVLGR